jgi:hypothetical protein
MVLRLPEPLASMERARRGQVAFFPRAARRPGVALALANVGYAALAGFVVLRLPAGGSAAAIGRRVPSSTA